MDYMIELELHYSSLLNSRIKNTKKMYLNINICFSLSHFGPFNFAFTWIMYENIQCAPFKEIINGSTKYILDYN